MSDEGLRARCYRPDVASGNLGSATRWAAEKVPEMYRRVLVAQVASAVLNMDGHGLTVRERTDLLAAIGELPDVSDRTP